MKKKHVGFLYPREKVRKLVTMTKICLLFVVFSLQLNAMSYSQQNKISLKLESASFEKVLVEIEKKSGLAFSYKQPDVANLNNLNLNFNDTEVKKILDYCLKGTHLTYFMIDNHVVIKKINQSQDKKQKTIKGKVVDEKGNPMPGVTVLIKGTNVGTATDSNGNFDMPVNIGDVLKFTFIGMKEIEVKIKSYKYLNVKLKEDKEALEEVVVTGQFQRKASSFTGSAVTMKKEDLLKVSNQNLFQSLKNIDPSLNIFDNLEFGSDPNKMPNMQLRGRSTFPMSKDNINLKGNFRDNPNMPLFVIDGFEAGVETVFDMDMDRVESVTILKDASAKAMWGSKAANGVIIIETKKTGSEKLRVSVSNSFQFQMPDLSYYNLCHAREKLQLEYDAGLYYDQYRYGMNLLMEKYNIRLSAIESGIDTDWMSKPLRTGNTNRTSVSVEVGDKNLKLVGQFSYNLTNGVMKGSSRKTLSGTINLSYRNKKFRFSNSLSVSQNNSDESPYGSFSNYTRMNPYWSDVDIHGKVHKNAGESYQVKYTNKFFKANPVYDAQLNSLNKSSYSQISNNFTVRYNIFQYLYLKAKLSVSKKTVDGDKFLPADHSSFAKLQGSDFFERGSYTKNNGVSNRLSGDFSANFSKQIGDKHYMFGYLGYNLSERNSQENVFEAIGFPSDKMNNIIFARKYANDKKPTGRETTSKEIGISSSFNYTYDERFLFDVTYRMNASSEFGEKQRWGKFWSTGLGWNLHNEPWINKDVVKRFKIRGSIGSTGSQGNAVYAAIAKYKYDVDKTYGNFIGAYLENMENENLKWQKKFDTNLGLDLNIKNKLDLSIDAYVSKTTDMLINFTIPQSLGFNTVKMNMGNVENKGIEISARYTAFNNPKERTYLNLTFRAAHNKNKITEISSALSNYNKNQEANSMSNASLPPIKYFDGMSMDAIWAVRSLGIDPSNGREIYLDKEGKMTYEYNAADQVVCGDKLPKLRGNFGCNFEYKGFGIRANFNYEIGADMYNTTLLNRIENVNLEDNVDVRIINSRWREPGQIASFKKLGKYYDKNTGKLISNETQATSRFIQKKNDLKLSSVNLSYDFYKSSILKALKLERLKLNFYMNDVFTLSTIKIERGTSYPFARSYNFSLQATF